MTIIFMIENKLTSTWQLIIHLPASTTWSYSGKNANSVANLNQIIIIVSVNFPCLISDCVDTGSWSSAYPTCGGQRQSPVNLVHATLKAYPKLELSNYGNIDRMTVTNNGHTGTCFNLTFLTFNNVNGSTVEAMQFFPFRSYKTGYSWAGFCELIYWFQEYINKQIHNSIICELEPLRPSCSIKTHILKGNLTLIPIRNGTSISRKRKLK